MEEFGGLTWRVSDPSILDVGTDFIAEKNIESTYVYKNHFKRYCYGDIKPNSNKQKTKLPPLPKFSQKSMLNKSQHLVCLKALELLDSERCTTTYTQHEQQILNTYNNLILNIHRENALFLKDVEKQWNNKLKNRTQSLLKRMLIFGKAKWKHEIESVKNYDQFYKIMNMLPISSIDYQLEMIHESCLLETGTVSRVTLPDLERYPMINLNYIPSLNGSLPRDESVTMTKLPASQDVYADYLAQKNECDIVITSSGLKTIMDNYGPDYNAFWNIPVVVKEYDINGTKKTIVFIDKPLPQRIINITDLSAKCRKTLLKTNLCKNVSHKFDPPNLPIKTDSEECSPCKRIKLEDTKPGDTKIVTRSSSKKLNESATCVTDSSCEADGSTASDKELVEEETTNVEEETGQEKPVKRYRTGKIQMHHNVSYRKWRLKLKDEKNTLLKTCVPKKEVKILVRCKTDGHELVNENGLTRPVTLVPKLEYQWEYGGELVSKSEIIRQWTSLYFRPFSNLLRVRMNGTNHKYVKIENISLKKIVNECLKHYSFTPFLHLGVLYNVLSNMVNLPAGNYLLHHTPKHGPFVALMRSFPDSTNDSLNLHSLYSPDNCKIDTTSRWNPIDTTLVLPHHNAHGLMPGMFPPHQVCKSWQGKQAGNTKNLKKKKSKFKPVKFLNAVSE